MEQHPLEVASGTVQTPDGQTHQIQGGAWLSPQAYLSTHAELERLRQHKADADASRVLPALVFGAGVAGVLLGYWLGRRSDDDAE